MTACFIDIETLPEDATVGMDLTAPPGWTPPDLEPIEVYRRTCPRNIKDPTKVAAWEAGEDERMAIAQQDAQQGVAARQAKAAADAMDHWRGASLDALRGRIALIAVAFGDAPVRLIDCAENERAGLVELAEAIAQQVKNYGPITWVAHNGLGFDFPWLQLRALRYRSTKLARCFYQDKPWSGVLEDTLEMWPGRSKRGGSLDSICAHLRIERDDNPIRGAEVLDAYVRGDWELVRKHGFGDVDDLRKVYRILDEVRL